MYAPTAQGHNRDTTRPNNAARKTFLSLTRILIASYFLANATGLVFDPASRTFFDGIFPYAQAQTATTIYLFATAFLIMVGYLVRVSSLLLAIWVFWSGTAYFGNVVTVDALQEFWRDMAMLGALLLVAVTQPGGSKQFDLWPDSIFPRRVSRKTSAKSQERPSKTQHQLKRNAILSEAQILSEDLSQEVDYDAEVDNIFSEGFDTQRGLPA